jgi:small-conductance mechanosensitive channel
MNLRRHVIHAIGLSCLFMSIALSETKGDADSVVFAPREQGVAVMAAGDTLFFIRTSLGPFTARQRADAINEKLRSIISKGVVDSIAVAESGAGSSIVADSLVLMVVTDQDAIVEGKGRAALAYAYADTLRSSIRLVTERYSLRSLLKSVGIAIAFLLALALAFWAMRKLFPLIYAKFESWEGKVFRPLTVRSRPIVSAESLSGFFIVLAKGIRLAISLALLYLFITYALSLFPWTSRWNVKPILIGIFLSILTTTAAIVLFRTSNSFFGLMIRKVGGWKGTVIKPIRLKTVEVLSEQRIAEMLEGAFKALKLLSFGVLGYFYITVLFSFFPFTQTWAGTLFGYIINPLWNVLTAFVAYLPNLFFIIVIAYVTRYVIKFIRLIFDEIEKGSLALPGFYHEWADPTYKIVRFLILAFAGIVIFPYLPGASSPVFQGVSVFLGILFSLGSTSAIANIIGGVVLTYMRPFKIGDRVKIADTVGDITEKTLLVTRVRTVKNVDISIPNAMVLGSHIINFSSSAKDPGLILHTTVTIGYDAPWKKVHELLIAAAAAVPDLLKEPAPFVLQTSLDDSYVSYELNAYTDRPNSMAGTYSALHQNIQDRFNEAGVEIMSPHYASVRDGNRTTIPDQYLPKSYTIPGFRIFPWSDHGKQT